MKTVLIIGKSGQLSWELQNTKPVDVSLNVLGSAQMDVSDLDAVMDRIASIQPDVVINASAYTAVDKAEEDAQQAHAVNANGPANLAKACASINARLFHVSTDFVFDGASSTPYSPDDTPSPTSVYGATKFAGERAVIAQCSNSVIVRTAWVYSAHGNNFVKTMLRLMGSKPELGVIDDQIGSPTWAKGLAKWLWAMVDKPDVTGIFHWTDAGVASWYDFAVAIQDLALSKGLLKTPIPIKPIPATDYPLPAKRPAYSVLNKHTAEAGSGLTAEHWQKQLSLMLDELKTQ